MPSQVSFEIASAPTASSAAAIRISTSQGRRGSIAEPQRSPRGADSGGLFRSDRASCRLQQAGHSSSVGRKPAEPFATKRGGAPVPCGDRWPFRPRASADCAAARRSAGSSARRASTRRPRAAAVRRRGRRAIDRPIPGFPSQRHSRPTCSPRRRARVARGRLRRRAAVRASRPTRTPTARAPGTTRASCSAPCARSGHAAPELPVITDVCLCQYTDHGACGVLGATARSTTTRPSSCSPASRSRTPRPARTSSRPPT